METSKFLFNRQEKIRNYQDFAHIEPETNQSANRRIYYLDCLEVGGEYVQFSQFGEKVIYEITRITTTDDIYGIAIG